MDRIYNGNYSTNLNQSKKPKPSLKQKIKQHRHKQTIFLFFCAVIFSIYMDVSSTQTELDFNRLHKASFVRCTWVAESLAFLADKQKYACYWALGVKFFLESLKGYI